MRPIKPAFSRRLSSTAALAACAALVATPAAAVDLPRASSAPVIYAGDAETVANHRHWRGHDRYRDRVGVGDVLAGVLVLGTIAAVASAANKSRDRVERYPSRYPYPEDPRYRPPYENSGPRGYESSGMDRAVDLCVAEVELGRERVASVDSASRGVDGWFVSGEVESGAPFTCRIDNDGRIGPVEVGDPYRNYSAIDGDEPVDADEPYYDAAAAPAVEPYYDDAAAPIDDRQYDDAVYLRARAEAPVPGG